MEAPEPAFIGLTGAIGSGKSETLSALARLGAATLSTDEVAHSALADPEVLPQLVERWGPEVELAGTVDRKRVGEIVFGDRDELRWLESLTHPKVAQKVVEWRQSLGPNAELAVVEVPLLFEAGMEGFFDGVLVVVAGDRRNDWLEARGDAGVAGRSGRQLSEKEKADRATWVVANDGTLADLEVKLRQLWPSLLAARGRT
ncbi:MAG: dephospho-CoA kinase [Actinomycetota bacterium]|nr:dephospho-CoA kinase [Actinomycetota bacterium]